MSISKVTALYFSPAGTTRLVTETLAKELAEKLEASFESISYTLPKDREAGYSFASDELVVWGSCVYAGRLPNKTLDFIKEAFKSDAGPVVSLAVYGNRSFDMTLAEMLGIVKQGGGRPTAAVGVPVRHAFSDKLAGGRPDEEELAVLKGFASEIAEKLVNGCKDTACWFNVPHLGEKLVYYTPKKTDGTPAVFLKAKPKLMADKCISCGKCAANCPMGSIEMTDGRPDFTGICIKCQACRRGCPAGAVYFDDEAFLSHVAMLEENFSLLKQPELFI